MPRKRHTLASKSRSHAECCRSPLDSSAGFPPQLRVPDHTVLKPFPRINSFGTKRASLSETSWTLMRCDDER